MCMYRKNMWFFFPKRNQPSVSVFMCDHRGALLSRLLYWTQWIFGIVSNGFTCMHAFITHHRHRPLFVRALNDCIVYILWARISYVISYTVCSAHVHLTHLHRSSAHSFRSSLIAFFFVLLFGRQRRISAQTWTIIIFNLSSSNLQQK